MYFLIPEVFIISGVVFVFMAYKISEYCWIACFSKQFLLFAHNGSFLKHPIHFHTSWLSWFLFCLFSLVCHAVHVLIQYICWTIGCSMSCKKNMPSMIQVLKFSQSKNLNTLLNFKVNICQASCETLMQFIPWECHLRSYKFWIRYVLICWRKCYLSSTTVHHCFLCCLDNSDLLAHSVHQCDHHIVIN